MGVESKGEFVHICRQGKSLDNGGRFRPPAASLPPLPLPARDHRALGQSKQRPRARSTLSEGTKRIPRLRLLEQAGKAA